MKVILATKLNMTQLYSVDGKSFPVTVLLAEKTSVSRLKSKEKDGYEALQVESGNKKREFRGSIADFKVGQEITVSDFKPGDKVKISGLTRGRGFAGFMKRHGFHGAPASHGHPHQRVPGSIGQAFPEHVRKGTRMAGRMGGVMDTMTGLTVLAVEPEKGLLFVKGSVPGTTGTFLKIVTTGVKKQIPELHVYGSVSAAAEAETKTDEQAERTAPAASGAKENKVEVDAGKESE